MNYIGIGFGWKGFFVFFMVLHEYPCNGFFFQNNIDFQTILLVSTFSKLFRKLTYRV